MDHQSIWQKTASIPSQYSSLSSDLTCEAVVLGAGLTGVLTAWMLQENGLNVVVLDSGTPGQGTTAHTTAKITAMHGYFYSDLISTLGIDAAKQYFSANQTSIDHYADLISTENISCDFKKTACYLYDRTSSVKVRNELSALKAMGVTAQISRVTELPFPVSAALALGNQALFHPLKFIYAFLPRLQIYGNTAALNISDGIVSTNHAAVKAKHIIVTTRFPFFLLPGLYFARMHQERSYALSIADVPPMHGMYIDTETNGISFRPWNGQYILSGFGHRTGQAQTQNGYDSLRLYAQRWYPGCKITAQWSAQDCIPADNIPYIGKYENLSSSIYVAAGFQKWGMTSAMTAARFLTSSVCGQKIPSTQLFSPHRFPRIKTLGNIVRDGGISSVNILKQVFYVPRSTWKDIQPGQGKIVQWKGCKVGVFRHENGKYYFVSTRCPHLGCQLSWNSTELSWDCPCHGSRFSYDGTRLDPPAARDLACKRRKA